MAAVSVTGLLRHKLQAELFTADNERIVGLAGVMKPGKKKKLSYLVITITIQQPQKCYIHRVKNMEVGKKADQFKKVKTWNFMELKLVDGKSKQHGDTSFSLHLERTTFKWLAVNSGEKEGFIAVLWKQVPRFSNYQNVEFVNVDKDRLKEMTHLSTTSLTGDAPVGREPSEETTEGYQELLPKEETDLNEILTSHEDAIQDTELLVEKISEELSYYDEVSIEAIIESEEQVQRLMERLSDSIVEVTLIEQNLSTYACLMDSVRSSIQKTDLEFRHVIVEDRNLFELRETLSDLVNKADLDERSEYVLKRVQLEHSTTDEVTRAAVRLEEILTEDFGNMSAVAAVQQQLKVYQGIRDTLSHRVALHLEGIFKTKSQEAMEMVSRRGAVQIGGLPGLVPHRNLFDTLAPYTGLVNWLKRMAPQTFREVCTLYYTMFGKVYDTEVKEFLAELKQRMNPKKGGSKIDDSTFSLAKSAQSMGSSIDDHSVSILSISSVGSGDGGEPMDMFYKAFEHVLEHIQPLCESEEAFCVKFFDFPQQKYNEETDGPFFLTEEVEVDGWPWRKVVDMSKYMEEGLRGILSVLFQVLSSQMEQLMQFGERMDSFNSLSILVYISRRWMSMAEDRTMPTYLDQVLTNAMPYAVRLFDKFLQAKVVEINESKPSKKKTKCGVLPCVKIFTRFAVRAESVMMTSDRRHELDRAYKSVTDAVLKSIEYCAADHPKTPKDVIRFENYHHLFDVLSKFKISCLEPSREDAKRSYKKYIGLYCKNSLGRPLEKLSVFFEGVERLLASNTRPEEVGFRVDFSKNVLRESILKYPGKEVRKGLEKLYKKVEKDISEEEGLLTVVWGHMQEAFINQVAQFDTLMKRCYPGTNMTLLFTIQELQQYFVSIVNQESPR